MWHFLRTKLLFFIFGLLWAATSVQAGEPALEGEAAAGRALDLLREYDAPWQVAVAPGARHKKSTLSITGVRQSAEFTGSELGTDAEADLTALVVEFSHRINPGARGVLIVNRGETEVEFGGRPSGETQELHGDGYGIGVLLQLSLEPVVLTLSTSVAESDFKFKSTSRFGPLSSKWDGQEMAVHIEIARPILLPGGVLLIPELGAYYLELEQDKHQLIGVNIPDTTRSSALLKAGLKWRGAVGCVEECPVQPWIGLAVTRELKDLPPQGPPLAFSHGIAGQRYTLFPKKGFVDSPAEFPNKWTAIASGGVDVQLGESNWWLSGSFVSRVNDEYRDVQGMVTLRLRI